jgi:preprotein translocase subunit SecY
MGLLDMLEPVFRIIPEIKSPEAKPALKTKLLWSGLALLIFFIMGNISLIGLEATSAEQLALFQTILASKIGTLVTVGIGPIVLASIILQLLIGAKVLNLNLQDPRDKAKFMSTQKLFAIFLCFFEAAAYAGFGIFPSLIQPVEGMFLFVLLQIALGSIVLLYLDEVVSKWGLGSGIGLFIAGGVTASFFWQLFAPPIETAQGLIGGRFWDLISFLFSGQMGLAMPILLAILFAVLIFVVVTFVEGVHVNIPITMGRRGTGGRYPVKFLYVSNMPVILAMALYANLQIWAGFTKDIPIVGWIMSGVTWVTTTPQINNMLLMEGLITSIFNPAAVSLATIGFELFHAVIYLAVLVVLCVVFGRFWIEMGNQGPEAVSNQLMNSGMSIPGFRRDPRIIRQILERYIPPISILGGAFVGLLAGVSNMTTGSLVSGIGILLTVGIIYRLYEELAREQVLESNVLLKRFFSG